jgi:atypical dual specificity phosphatase
MNRQVIEIPFGFRGRIYRSPMPFSSYDKFNLIWAMYKKLNIQSVLVLTEIKEIGIHSKRNLLDFYRDNRLRVLHFPIADFSIPKDSDEFNRMITQVVEKVDSGVNLAIHCLAGLGRTGLVLATIAKYHYGFDGDTAIQWVRREIPGAIENLEQMNFIRDYQISCYKGDKVDGNPNDKESRC